MTSTDILIQKLENMKNYLEQTNDTHCYDILNDILDDLVECDAFGTEGQNDPRGDRRNNDYHQSRKTIKPSDVVNNLINDIKETNDEDYSSDMYESFNDIFERFGF